MSKNLNHLPFGWRTVPEDLELLTFAPDSEGLPWFATTGERRLLSGLIILETEEKSVAGKCIDTGEYLSPYAQIVEECLEQAPPASSVAAIDRRGGIGSRTWYEDITVRFYGN